MMGRRVSLIVLFALRNVREGAANRSWLGFIMHGDSERSPLSSISRVSIGHKLFSGCQLCLDVN